MPRITKKDIYKEFGIEFQSGSTEKILSPIGWIPVLLVDGNGKIGKSVWHFSSLPGNKEYTVHFAGKEYTTTGTCADLCEGCYGTRGNYQYDSTIDSIGVRTIIAREYPEFFERAIMAQIKADHIKTVRIHATGDFFSRAYLNTWKRVIAAYPETIFWTYTKETAAESAFDEFQNANIVKSNVPMLAGIDSSTNGYNYGHCDYIMALYDFLKSMNKSVYICRCGIDKNQHCTNCTACAKCENVLFIEHSTGYKAEKDPLYNDIVALIESQDKSFITAEK